MEYQVLSIDKMKRLEELGVKTNDASCCWTSINDKDYNPISWMVVWRGKDAIDIEKMRESFPLTCKEGNIYYAYTYEDVIKKLPNNAVSCRMYDEYYIAVTIDSVTKSFISTSPVDAAYEALVWVMENNNYRTTNR